MKWFWSKKLMLEELEVVVAEIVPVPERVDVVGAMVEAEDLVELVEVPVEIGLVVEPVEVALVGTVVGETNVTV